LILRNASLVTRHASLVTCHRATCAGFSLTEALVALAAGLAVLGAAFQGLTHFQQKLLVQQQTIAWSQDLRLGLQVLATELRLAGTGGPASAPAVLIAEEQEIEFEANLAGLTTVLTEAAEAGQLDLVVESGSGWSKGKRIVLCASDASCAAHHLARDGRSRGLTLTSPLTQAFPAGTGVSVSNRVRYYLRADPAGKASLMRMVDGGANALMGDIGFFRLSHLDGGGRPVRDAAQVARVRVEVGTEGGGWTLTQEVGLRGAGR